MTKPLTIQQCYVAINKALKIFCKHHPSKYPWIILVMNHDSQEFAGQITDHNNHTFDVKFPMHLFSNDEQRYDRNIGISPLMLTEEKALLRCYDCLEHYYQEYVLSIEYADRCISKALDSLNKTKGLNIRYKNLSTHTKLYFYAVTYFDAKNPKSEFIFPVHNRFFTDRDDWDIEGIKQYSHYSKDTTLDDETISIIKIGIYYYYIGRKDKNL